VSAAAPVRTLRAGRYAIIGELGAGSQAETLDAVDKQDGRAVAIKRFQVRGAKSWKDVELAEREARVLSTLSHPNLPVYIEHFEEDGALYLVMEKIEGETLASLRKRKALLSNDDLARFLSDAELALGYLHSRVPPIIHRDIKPGNVIRRADGSFAFVDFGSVRDQLKPEGGSTVVGTFGYMAPEQFQGRALPGSDVYAVAATALTLATGREPEDLPHRGLCIDVPAALGPGAEPWLVRALSAMLEPDPDKRPQRVTPRRPAPSASTRSQAREETRSERRERERAERARQRAAYSDWQSPDLGDLRGIREQGRAQREQVREEGRRLRRELKQQIRDETRRIRRQAREYRRARPEHWQGRPAGFGPAAPLLISVVVLALTLARVGTFALFRVFLPTLLLVLSVFFGRGPRRAAFRCREIGIQGDRGLLHAIDAVRGRITGRPDIEVDAEPVEANDPEPSEQAAPPPSVQPTPRVRVSGPETRVEGPDLELEEPELVPERRQQR
jgi:tRNA A-37 threonylcarbamoyl transferase component Bud32